MGAEMRGGVQWWWNRWWEGRGLEVRASLAHCRLREKFDVVEGRECPGRATVSCPVSRAILDAPPSLQPIFPICAGQQLGAGVGERSQSKH